VKPERVLIGGVGYRWQGDASVGLLAAEALGRMDLPPGVEVADLGYGAIYAAQDIAAAQPSYERVVLLATAERGRAPGRVYRVPWQRAAKPDADALQALIRDAGAGVLHPDHLLAIGEYFGAWPEEVVLLEAEPGPAVSGDQLSAEGERVLHEMIAAAREAALAPLGATRAGT
jgi:hydrogenase maturation protease